MTKFQAVYKNGNVQENQIKEASLAISQYVFTFDKREKEVRVKEDKS